MKRMMMTALLAGGLTVGGCATTNPYGDGYYNDGRNSSQGTRAATGAVAGAVAGAAVGAVVPGVSVGTGAIVGGIAGAVLGAVVNGRQYYRDTRGYCYYVDRNGQPVYDQRTSC